MIQIKLRRKKRKWFGESNAEGLATFPQKGIGKHTKNNNKKQRFFVKVNTKALHKGEYNAK